MEMPCCARCGKDFREAFPCKPGETVPALPSGGTVFTSHGNYGSTLYDLLPGEQDEYLIIYVCDDCLALLATAGEVIRTRVGAPSPVTYERWQPEGT